VRTRTWLSCALTAVLLVGCASDPTSRAVGDQMGAPKYEPPPPLVDVTGTIDEVTVNDLSGAGSGLHPDGSAGDAAVPVDQGAVDAAVDAAVRWLDDHLTGVQSGGEGRVTEAGLTGDPGAVSSELTGPDHRVTGANYTATVGALGGPEWIRMATIVRREDGEMTATFVFVPDGDDVALVAAQRGEGTPAPPSAPVDDDAPSDAQDDAQDDA
jgi:hypothetical protein